MHRFAVSAVLLLGVACAAPTPTPTSVPTPTLAPISTVSPTAIPTLSAAVSRALEGWRPACGDLPFLDCYGVAALFVNNLAWSGGSVLEQSGGVVTVTPRAECPAVPDWADPGHCWQATAPTREGPVCMVIARQTDLVGTFGFGQVGGDDLSGRVTSPTDPTPQPCT